MSTATVDPAVDAPALTARQIKAAERKAAKQAAQDQANAAEFAVASARQIADGLAAAGLPVDTELAPEQADRAMAWPKGLRNGALKTYILTGETFAEQTKAAVANRENVEKAIAATKPSDSKVAPAKPAKPAKARPWNEVDQPDVPLLEAEQNKVKGGSHVGYLVLDNGDLRLIGVFADSDSKTSGGRPSDVIRAAIAKMPGMDVSKAEAASFVSFRPRAARVTQPIKSAAAE